MAYESRRVDGVPIDKYDPSFRCADGPLCVCLSRAQAELTNRAVRARVRGVAPLIESLDHLHWVEHVVQLTVGGRVPGLHETRGRGERVSVPPIALSDKQIQFMRHRRELDRPEIADPYRLTTSEARDCALRIFEQPATIGPLGGEAGAVDQVDRETRSNIDVARIVVTTENHAYRSAWLRYLRCGPQAAFTDEERKQLIRQREYRNQLEGTTTLGGFAVPPTIDPSVALTDATVNPFRTSADVIDISTFEHRSVIAATPAWSFDTEAAEVSDDSTTLAQPVIDVHTARGFIP